MAVFTVPPKRSPRNGRTARAHIPWIEAHVDYDGEECLMWPFPKGENYYPRMLYRGRFTTPSRVMCELVYGPPPSLKYQAAHSCGRGKQGCMNPRHLRWDTPKGNNADKLAHDTHNRGERNSRTKLTEADVRYIREMRGRVRDADLARKFGVTPTGIFHIQHRHAWAWLE
jgi:hypothetical protein